MGKMAALANIFAICLLVGFLVSLWIVFVQLRIDYNDTQFRIIYNYGKTNMKMNIIWNNGKTHH